MEHFDVTKILMGVVALGIEVGCLAFFITLGCLSLRRFRATWKRGLGFGLLCAALALPATVLGLSYLDVKHLFPDMDPDTLPVMRVIIGVFSVIFMFVQIPLRGLYYHVAAVEWGRVRAGVPAQGFPVSVPPVVAPLVVAAPVRVVPAPPAGPYPAVSFAGGRAVGIIAGSIVGIVAGVLSAALFERLHIDAGDALKNLQKLLPGITGASPALLLVSTTGFVIAAAMVEEMIFRGGLLGFLLRITKNSTAFAWICIVATSIPWALLHWENTDNPAVKLSQIFILGIAFGWLARKWGLFSSIAAHVGLNVTVVVCAIILHA